MTTHRTAQLTRLILIALAALAIGSCQSSPSVPADSASTHTDAIPVMVTIMPQAWFAERIGGSHVSVGVLVGAGQSPHTYEPTSRQMAELARARVYFAVGLPIETPILDKVRSVAPHLDIVDTRKGVTLRTMTEDEVSAAEAAEHGPDADHATDTDAHHDHDHEAGAPDPHFWLDPARAAVMADNMAAALERVDPAHAADYRSNLAAVRAELDRTSRRIADLLAPLRGKTIFVYHPAFGYFAAAYGLRQMPVETGGKEPSAKRLAELVKAARAEDVKVIFVQAQFSRSGAQVVAREIGGAVIPMDPLARDYLANLEAMAERVHRALATENAP